MRFGSVVITILLFNSVYLVEFVCAWTITSNYSVVVPLTIFGISFFVACVNKLFNVAVEENRKFEVELQNPAHPQCENNECCTFPHIKFDISGLREDLQKRLFGQHVASRAIVSALLQHQGQLEDLKVTKPLVLSLHGGPGTGKHYTVDLMVKHLYMMGESSQYVHRFNGKDDFPDASNAEAYREIIRTKVYKALRSCERALIIFDNMHESPDVVVESISAVLEHLANMGGTAYQRATILLISNSGADVIRQVLEQNMNAGLLRERTQLDHYTEALQAKAYVSKSRAVHKLLIAAGLVDAYIPFLPLQREHVEKCIAHEYRRHKTVATSDDTIIVSNKLSTSQGDYVANGCKDVSEKVAKSLIDRNEL